MHLKGKKLRIRDIEYGETANALMPNSEINITNFEVGVHEDREIIVPSFGPTSALFTRHLETLRNLRRRVDLLKQAYHAQMDQTKCFAIVDEIILALDGGFKYLSIAPHEKTVLEKLEDDQEELRIVEELYDDQNIDDDE
jgi:hypothetical protein